MKNLPKKKVIIAIAVFAIYCLVIYALFLATKPASVEKVSQSAPANTYIAQTKPEGKTTIDSKVIAAKLDLTRKVIVPKSSQNTAQIVSIIEKQGGIVEKKNTGVIVAHFPKASDSQISESLAATNSVSSLGIDYPIAVAADTQDWGVTRIKAADVWSTTRADGIKVAVIDTGIDYNHPELTGRYGGGYDTANDDTDPFDDHGHGTHVSGIVASTVDNGGYVGVAPGVQVLGVKALGADGSGYISDIVEAIDWSIRNGAQVINFSLGTTYNSSVLESKLNEAASRGIILVAAAGNTNGGSLLYPAAYGSVISVAATDRNDNFASFSSVGAEIAAPGAGISSAVPGGGYATWSGTSMASPHVAATVALMIANKQTNIRENLYKTAIDLGSSGKDSLFGHGLVHAKPAALGEDTLAPIVTILTPENNSTVNGEVLINFSVQDENTIINTKLFINNAVVQEWTATPSAYTWDTTKLTDSEYVLHMQATDTFDNIGEAKVTVIVSKSEPIVTPTKTQSLSITNMPWLNQGKSADVRQDINNENVQEHRQNYENMPQENKNTEKKENNTESASASVPDVTNMNERNQKNEAPGQVVAEDNKEKVKGAVTAASLWDRIILWIQNQ